MNLTATQSSLQGCRLHSAAVGHHRSAASVQANVESRRMVYRMWLLCASWTLQSVMLSTLVSGCICHPLQIMHMSSKLHELSTKRAQRLSSRVQPQYEAYLGLARGHSQALESAVAILESKANVANKRKADGEVFRGAVPCFCSHFGHKAALCLSSMHRPAYLTSSPSMPMCQHCISIKVSIVTSSYGDTT